MTTKRLYAVTLPGGAQTATTESRSVQQALQAVLGSDTGSVESIATDPATRPVTVDIPDQYAAVRAAELRELAAGFSQPVPYYGTAASTADDGYYTVSQVRQAGPIDPRSDQFQRVSLELTRDGSPASHWRRVRTDPAQVDHPFGNTLEAPVGIPAAASKVRWFDAATAATAQPTVQTTRTGAGGDVDILDADVAPYDAPEVIYELPFAEDRITDPRVWDTRGLSARTDGNGALQWAKVFAASHRFEGEIEIDNECFRLRVDESGSPGLSAERYTSGSWSSVSLGASDWEVFDWDIRTIGTAQVAGVAEFQDTTQSPTAYHTLRWQFQRGAETILWSTDSSVPAGLETLLAPIAADHVYDPYGDVRAAPAGLRARTEVTG